MWPAGQSLTHVASGLVSVGDSALGPQHPATGETLDSSSTVCQALITGQWPPHCILNLHLLYHTYTLFLHLFLEQSFTQYLYIPSLIQKKQQQTR